MAKMKPNKTWGVLILALSGLFISTWLANKGTLVLGEEKLLAFVFGWPESWRIGFLILTLLGSVWILAVVLIALLIKERYDTALRIMVAGISAAAVANFAKTLVERPRPVMLTEILQREIFVLGYGFPSGHVALATALSVTLGAYLPKKYWYIVPLWIFIVATSRLYLGVHAPLDLVGGFCIGLLAAMCVLLVLPVDKKLRGIRIAKKHKQG